MVIFTKGDPIVDDNRNRVIGYASMNLALHPATANGFEVAADPKLVASWREEDEPGEKPRHDRVTFKLDYMAGDLRVWRASGTGGALTALLNEGQYIRAERTIS